MTSPPTPSIRPAKPEDHADVWRLITENIAWDQGDRTSNQADFSNDIVNWKKNKRRHFVATEDDLVVGFASIREWPKAAGKPTTVGIATVIAVDPSFQAQGVGSNLLHASLQAASKLSFSMLVAAATESSGKFLSKRGWQVGAENAGLAWIERERPDSAGGRMPDDVVGILDSAAPIRSSPADKGQGYNRPCYIVLDGHEITDVWHYCADPTQSDNGAFKDFAERVAADHLLVEKLQLSTMLWALGAIAELQSPFSARQVAQQWLKANPSGTSEVPKRLKQPSKTADQIFDRYFGPLH